ncbi:MAG: hypothetical protein DCF16_05275 [Alphaproteobacteria bacterium]|nr:MAG: hypothetical protein DCF16_05275 [Alphaproteobacteria bacterium]
MELSYTTNARDYMALVQHHLNGFNKGLEDLFKGLDVLKRGFDLLSTLGVESKPFDEFRDTLGEALDAVAEKADKENLKNDATA